MKYDWQYRKFGNFTYNVLPQRQIKPFLLKWVKREWEKDHAEFPDQSWTIEWLDLLGRMEFELEELDIGVVQLRSELMRYKTDADDFLASLAERAREREESLLRGVSTEPLLVNREGWELMDGYTRYMVLKKCKQKKILAYIGAIKEKPNKRRQATV